MPSVLSYAMAFPGIPMPQHLSGQTKVQSFIFPGALQPKATGPAVLSWTNAFPGIPAPQHFSGQTKIQNFLYPGALQLLQPPAAPTVDLIMGDMYFRPQHRSRWF